MPIEHSYGNPDKQNILPPKKEKTMTDVFIEEEKVRAQKMRSIDAEIAGHVEKHKITHPKKKRR